MYLMEENVRSIRIKKIINTLTGNFSNVLIFLIIVYFLFIVGRSMYNSYEDHKKIDLRRAEIEELRLKVIYLENQNLYYQTESFKEKEARKKLGMVKPGENVVALDREGGGYQAVVVNNESEIQIPNYLKWWNYFFSD